MNMKKALALMLAVLMIVTATVAGTVAWLTTFTEEVRNTFSVGNIEIDLQETVDGDVKSAKKEDVGNNNFKIIPGTTQDKDPKVIVKNGSEPCWVFVTVKEENNAAEYITYAVDTNWSPLMNEGAQVTADGAKVYYREYASGGATWSVLTGDQVSYSQDLTKAKIEALDMDGVGVEGHGTIEADELPQLTFKAYAIQKVGFESNPSGAWTEVSK